MKTVAISAGLLLLASANGAQAQPPTTVVADSPFTQRIAYEPADLASQAGVSSLRARVRTAARQVCNLDLDTPTAEYRERNCYNATLPAALSQVDSAVARWARGEQPNAPRILVAAR